MDEASMGSNYVSYPIFCRSCNSFLRPNTCKDNTVNIVYAHYFRNFRKYRAPGICNDSKGLSARYCESFKMDSCREKVNVNQLNYWSYMRRNNRNCGSSMVWKNFIRHC